MTDSQAESGGETAQSRVEDTSEAVEAEEENESVIRLAELLGVSTESIRKKLSAKWVKPDSFVPIKTIQKLTDQELMAEYPSEETIRKKELQDALLAIPGVLITDVEIRDYPLGKAAAPSDRLHPAGDGGGSGKTSRGGLPVKQRYRPQRHGASV